MAGLAAASVILGCGPGDGVGLNASGRPSSESGDVPLAATLEAIQANVFDTACIVCHAGAAAPLGLRLDKGSSFVNLVGVSSRQVGSLLRVDPGDPDRSYLVRKLEGTAAEGGQMPLGGAPVPQATIDFVRQWISDGALPDAPGTPAGPPVIISMTPAPDSTNPTLPAEVTVGFDGEIDASTVNTETFILQRAGGDDQFGDAADVDVTAPVGLSPANPRLAVMDLGDVAAVDDLYRVVLRGSGPNVVLDIDGVALDGEFTGNLPSGDGLEGGDFEGFFEVRGLQASLDSIQANIFGPTCAVAGCHTGPAGMSLPQGMDLSSSDTSFANLVGVVSTQDPPLQRVAPGDANASYLVQKLEGTAAVGQTMPAGGSPLDPATIDVIRTWINNGAER